MPLQGESNPHHQISTQCQLLQLQIGLDQFFSRGSSNYRVTLRAPPNIFSVLRITLLWRPAFQNLKAFTVLIIFNSDEPQCLWSLGESHRQSHEWSKNQTATPERVLEFLEFLGKSHLFFHHARAVCDVDSFLDGQALVSHLICQTSFVS